MSLAYLSDNIKRNTYLLEHLLLASGLQTFILKIKRKLAKQFQFKKIEKYRKNIHDLIQMEFLLFVLKILMKMISIYLF